MSMLLGAAKLLKEREKELKGTVLLVFQPAEEGGAGGALRAAQIEAGRAAFGMHATPSPHAASHPTPRHARRGRHDPGGRD
jgi:metal-dependent amidase/aminoacylase/carboxypeptidase family protein